MTVSETYPPLLHATPPPNRSALLALIIQLVITPPAVQKAPPPLFSVYESPARRVWPPVNVKPERTAVLATYAQRTAESPRGPEPTMIVLVGPPTLTTTTFLVSAMRLRMDPLTIVNPLLYCPSATSTVSPSSASFTADWILVAAVAQEV